MQPNVDKSPALNLPEPLAAVTPPSERAPQERLETAMRPTSSPVPVTGVATLPAPWLPPTVPVAGRPAEPSQPGQDDAVQVTTPAAADDADLIEKEWVIKAKQIVERTRQDPSVQSREMNKFKADYMKKRYNRVIKQPEA